MSRNFRNEISPPIIRFLPVTRLEFAAPRGEREGKRREGRTSFRGAHTCVSTKIRSLNTGCGWNSSGSRHVPREPRHVRRFVDFFADSKAKTPRLCRVPVHSKRPPGWLHPFGAVSTIGRPHFVRDWTEMGWLAEVNGVLWCLDDDSWTHFALPSRRKGTV